MSEKKIGYDISSYRSSPDGIRIWCGPTIEITDIYVLLNWIKWYVLEYYFIGGDSGSEKEKEDENKKMTSIPKNDVDFSYRYSTFPEDEAEVIAWSRMLRASRFFSGLVCM